VLPQEQPHTIKYRQTKRMTTELPAQMTRIEMTGSGGPEVLEPARASLPRPGPGQVLIAVEAAGVNRPDVLQRLGKYPPPPDASPILGLEVAGRVAAVGQGVTECVPGDAVCALTPGGGYAEYALAPAAHCLPIPAGYSMIEAAALPENHFTVWSNVFQRGRLANGESLLVHGGSSGIGTTAIQLAVAHGARVLVTVGSADKARECQRLGAERAINYRSEDFEQAVAEWSGGQGVDVILDMVGGEYIPRNLRSLALDGRLVQIAYLEGSTVKANFLPLMTRRLTWTGSTLRPQSNAAKAAIAADLKSQVWPLLESGSVRPLIHATFPLEHAGKAHALMESGTLIGKIVLMIGKEEKNPLLT